MVKKFNVGHNEFRKEMDMSTYITFMDMRFSSSNIYYETLYSGIRWWDFALEGPIHSKSARSQALYHLRRQFKFRCPPRGLEEWTYGPYKFGEKRKQLELLIKMLNFK